MTTEQQKAKQLHDEAKRILIRMLSRHKLARTLPDERGAWTLWAGETNITALVMFVVTGNKPYSDAFEVGVFNILSRIADWLPMSSEIDIMPEPSFKDRLMAANTKLRLSAASVQTFTLAPIAPQTKL